MIKKYAYQDWWEGKICLTYCNVMYNKGDKQKVISVSWNDFIDSDAKKIKAKQEELFESKRQELFKKRCDDFTSNYSRSELKSTYLNDEIFDFESILFNSDQSYYIENFELEGIYYVAFHLKNRNVSFIRHELNKIRDYTERRLKRGIPKRFDFIHSPNFPFQNEDLSAPGEVYAQVCWDYLKWLKNFGSAKKQNLILGNNSKVFPAFLTHEHKIILANKLKQEFIIEKGAGLRLMTKVLSDKSVLTIPERQMKIFFQSMKIYFNRDIGSYSGFNDWKFVKEKSSIAYEKTVLRIDKILESIQNNIDSSS